MSQEREITIPDFCLPVDEEVLADSFGAITLGIFRNNRPEYFIREKVRLERENSFLYLNMLWMETLREKAGMSEFDDAYEVGYMTFSDAASDQACQRQKKPYEFNRDDIYMAFSDLTQERRHPKWKSVFDSLGEQSDPLHPLTVITLIAEHKTNPTVAEVVAEIEAQSKIQFKAMIDQEKPIKKMLEHTANIDIDYRMMRSYAYGLMDAWNIHNAYLFLRRAHGMYTPENPNRYEY